MLRYNITSARRNKTRASGFYFSLVQKYLEHTDLEFFCANVETCQHSNGLQVNPFPIAKRVYIHARLWQIIPRASKSPSVKVLFHGNHPNQYIGQCNRRHRILLICKPVILQVCKSESHLPRLLGIGEYQICKTALFALPDFVFEHDDNA